MVNNTSVPDAWEDDWESQADRIAKEPPKPKEAQPEPPATRSQRLARHAESNRKLWESAETPETLPFVEAATSTPFGANFKPQVKVLSRKPIIAKKDPTTGALSQLTLDDDDDENAKKAPQLTPEEIRAKQKREREEKQRRYDEARAKIFGESNPSSGASSPGTVTPPRSDGRHTPQSGGRGRGGRGGGGGGGGGGRAGAARNSEVRQQGDMQRLIGQQSSAVRELYDPNYMSKPEGVGLRRAGDVDSPSRSQTPRREQQQQQQQQAIRAPRGPDGSGRGGFGFARRGGDRQED